jgi:hypothetical protein
MPKPDRVSAWLVVRATVANAADRAAFDRWYHDEHLPDAMKAFAVTTAWRGWSQNDPSVHCAYYRFDSLDRLNSIMTGPDIQALIEEFDRHWKGRVTRTREVMSVADELGKEVGGI